MKNFKTIMIIAVIVILIILALLYYLVYFPYQQKKLSEKIRAEGITDYKKDFYYGILCEYNCPLKPQEFENKTQIMPELDCIKNCTINFRTKYANNNFTNKELTGDDILKDIKSSVDDCKKQSFNTDTFVLNNTEYFSCSGEKLFLLKEKYDYLD
jgi:hypothetical protein